MMQSNDKDAGASGLFGATAGGGKVEAGAASGWITAYCDGGSRGNPGPSGFGVFLQNDAGQAVAELSEFLGKQTNNYAEYSGLLASLQYVLDKGHSRLKVVSDSELMVKQIKGQYRVNSPDLKPLYDEAKRRIARLEQFRIEHVLRGKNQQADRLANLAMDRGTGKSVAAASGAAAASTGSGFRAAVRAVGGVGSSATAPAAAARSFRGLVKGGVIHLVEGELPEGTLVKVTPEGR